MKNLFFVAMGMAAALGITGSADASLMYGQSLTGNAIWGSGNSDVGFTVDQFGEIELGLRGRLRFNASGTATNILNNNGSDNRYYFNPGVAPTQSSPTPVWSFDWSINSNYDGALGSNLNLNGYYYSLGLDFNPNAGAAVAGDFNVVNPLSLATPFAHDNSFGNNGTGQGQGTELTFFQLVNNGAANYSNLMSSNNLVQNSWRGNWNRTGFNPTLNGTYDIYLAAFSDANRTNLLARTNIQIVVGDGGPLPPAVVPVPAAAPLGLLGMGLVAFVRRRKNAKA